MKTTAIAILTSLVLVTPAVSGPLKSLTEIQQIVDDGGYQHYSGTKTEHRTPQYPWVLGASLEVGSVAPRVINHHALLRAAKKKQVVKVSGPADFCYPVYEELAKQNKVSCSVFMDHLETRWDESDGDSFVASIDVMEVVADVLPMVEAEVKKMSDNDDSAPVSAPVTPEPDFIPAEQPFAADTDQRDVDALKAKVSAEAFENLRKTLCRVRQNC